MIFEYTPEERQKLEEIEKRYGTQLHRIDIELKKQKEGTEEYNRLLDEMGELGNARIGEIGALFDQAEKARLDAFNGDISAIAAEARRQVDLIIKSRLAFDIVVDEDATQNSSQPEFKPRHKKETRHFISSDEARKLIKSNLNPIVKYLHDNAPEEEKALERYITEYIRKSPYTYQEATTPSAEPLIVTEDIRMPLQTIKKYGLMNDKTMRQLITGNFSKKENNGQLSFWTGVNQAGAAGKTPVVVTMALSFTRENTTLSCRMNAFDNAVYNAISTAFFYHKLTNDGKPFCITPQEIWRLMTGTQDASKNPSPGQVKRVCDSMDKMRFTRLYMDISNEMEAFNLTFDDKRLTKGRIDTYLLKSDKVSFTTEKGKEVVGYRIDNEPILYTYNKAKDHILFVPFNLLDTSQTTGNEGSTIEIKNYLLQQIQLMYNGLRNSCRILYKTLYSATGLADPEHRIDRNEYANENTYKTKIKQEAKKDREKITSILEAWKAKGYIKDFAPIQKSRAFIGVDITLQEKDPTQATLS